MPSGKEWEKVGIPRNSHLIVDRSGLEFIWCVPMIVRMIWWKKATIASVIITLLIALASYALVQRNAAAFADPEQRDAMDTKAGEVAGESFAVFNAISWGIF